GDAAVRGGFRLRGELRRPRAQAPLRTARRRRSECTAVRATTRTGGAAARGRLGALRRAPLHPAHHLVVRRSAARAGSSAGNQLEGPRIRAGAQPAGQNRAPRTWALVERTAPGSALTRRAAIRTPPPATHIWSLRFRTPYPDPHIRARYRLRRLRVWWTRCFHRCWRCPPTACANPPQARGRTDWDCARSD